MKKAIAYVDGSFSDEEKAFASGAVILFDGKEFQFSERRTDANLISMRNVAGEIVAAWRAMKYCLDNGIEELELYHDYEGVAAWCTGRWKTNKEGTKAYRNYYLRIKEKLKVRFIKVKGHSGDKYNDLADKLAKEALFGNPTEGWEVAYGEACR
ncbi:MAG: reverse transcriptase-like protein [Lachnospiraceae bacterium]|nr:reverse transcriptase-like protein [Lachnospiraceae bacterium]